MYCPICTQEHKYSVERCLVKTFPLEVCGNILPKFVQIIKFSKFQNQPLIPQSANIGLLFLCLDYFYSSMGIPPNKIMELTVALLEKVAEVRGDELRINLAQQYEETIVDLDSNLQDKTKGN